MKYWIPIVSLFIFACSDGESGSTEEDADTVGADIADTLNDAQDAAANVENVLQDARDDVDAAVEAAEEGIED